MILAIDTALAAVSACVIAPGATVPAAFESLPMQTGHAEALFPLLDRLIARVPDGFASLTRIAVTVGPGSFTGIRVGVAAARAVGLARRIPVVGVSTLAALAGPAMAAGIRPPLVAAIDARHGNVFVQAFGARGGTLLGPALLPAIEVARALAPGPLRLVGSGGPLVVVAAGSLGVSAEADEGQVLPDIAFVARIGALADPQRAPPRPLYLKAADARPPALSALVAGPA